MKYSDKGRVISCQVSPCWSAKTELSGERRKEVKPSRVMEAVRGTDELEARSPEFWSDVGELEYLSNKLKSSDEDKGDCKKSYAEQKSNHGYEGDLTPCFSFMNFLNTPKLKVSWFPDLNSFL